MPRPGSRARQQQAASGQHPGSPARARRLAAARPEVQPRAGLDWVHLLAAAVGTLAGVVLYGVVTGAPGDAPLP
ncbi:MAG: hypothetical protein VKQ33_00560 [Candidatus Sericytochromatia bacterium]|nr:hypothetical protein [Candidatus Sericytochromatia bacterium]